VNILKFIDVTVFIFLSYSGLYHNQSGFNAEDVLGKLLSGEYHIKRKPWKPQDNEEFYIVAVNGDIIRKFWDDCSVCKNYYKIGNLYRTKEEAESNREKWLTFYSSDMFWRCEYGIQKHDS